MSNRANGALERNWDGLPPDFGVSGAHYLRDAEGDVIIALWATAGNGPPHWQMHGTEDSYSALDIREVGFSYIGPVPSFNQT